MTKQLNDDILYDESFKHKKCDKIKIKVGINREKVLLFHLDQLSNYYFSRLTRKDKTSRVHLSEI